MNRNGHISIWQASANGFSIYKPKRIAEQIRQAIVWTSGRLPNSLLEKAHGVPVGCWRDKDISISEFIVTVIDGYAMFNANHALRDIVEA